MNQLQAAWVERRRRGDGVRVFHLCSAIGVIQSPVFLAKQVEVLPPESGYQQASKTSSFDRIYQQVKRELGI